jgi:hypothetical protein
LPLSLPTLAAYQVFVFPLLTVPYSKKIIFTLTLPLGVTSTKDTVRVVPIRLKSKDVTIYISNTCKIVSH